MITYYRDNEGYVWRLRDDKQAIPLRVLNSICLLDAAQNEDGAAEIQGVGKRWIVSRWHKSKAKIGYDLDIVASLTFK